MTYLIFRNNINFYFNEKQNILTLISYEKYFNLKCSKIEYEEFKNLLLNFKQRNILKDDIKRMSDFEKKAIYLLNQLQAFYESNQVKKENSSLYKLLTKHAFKPEETMKKLKKKIFFICTDNHPYAHTEAKKFRNQ